MSRGPSCSRNDAGWSGPAWAVLLGGPPGFASRASCSSAWGVGVEEAAGTTVYVGILPSPFQRSLRPYMLEHGSLTTVPPCFLTSWVTRRSSGHTARVRAPGCSTPYFPGETLVKGASHIPVSHPLLLVNQGLSGPDFTAAMAGREALPCSQPQFTSQASRKGNDHTPGAEEAKSLKLKCIRNSEVRTCLVPAPQTLTPSGSKLSHPVIVCRVWTHESMAAVKTSPRDESHPPRRPKGRSHGPMLISMMLSPPRRLCKWHHMGRDSATCPWDPGCCALPRVSPSLLQVVSTLRMGWPWGLGGGSDLSPHALGCSQSGLLWKKLL